MRKEIVKKTNFKCLSPTLTNPKLKNLQEFLENDQKLLENLNWAEIVGAEARIKILKLLSKQSWLSVCDIADILKSNGSGVSHQLAILRRESLVETKKKERVVLYSLADTLPELIQVAIA